MMLINSLRIAAVAKGWRNGEGEGRKNMGINRTPRKNEPSVERMQHKHATQRNEWSFTEQP